MFYFGTQTKSSVSSSFYYYHINRMATPAAAEQAQAEISVKASVQLLLHSIIAPKPGAKGKPKEKKETKTKELTFVFMATMENYIDLLKAILTKHGEEKYNITERKRYGIKVLVPPNRAYVIHICIPPPTTTSSTNSKGDAVDVENFSDYKDLVGNLTEKKPNKITIFVDMNDIKLAWSTRGSGGSDDEDEGQEEGVRQNLLFFPAYMLTLSTDSLRYEWPVRTRSSTCPAPRFTREEIPE
jgi:hypothetical protein